MYTTELGVLRNAMVLVSGTIESVGLVTELGLAPAKLFAWTVKE